MRIYRLLISALFAVFIAAALILADNASTPSVINLGDPSFGAVLSKFHTTVDTTAASGAFANLGALGDLHVGDHVVVAHAGDTPTAMATPVIGTVVNEQWSNSPWVPTAAPTATSFADYSMVAVNGIGGTSPVPATSEITTSSGTTSGNIWNDVPLTGHVTGAVAYKVYGGIAPSASATPVEEAIIPDTTNVTPDWHDMGSSTYLSSTVDPIDTTALPAGVLSNNLFTTIKDCGATVTGALCTSASGHFNNNAGTSRTGTWIAHDAQPALQTAIGLECAGGTVILPKGFIPLGQMVTIDACSGFTLQGSGTSLSGSVLLNMGQAGMTGLYVNRTRAAQFTNFRISSGADQIGASFGVAIDIDNNNATGSTLTTNNLFSNLSIGEGGVSVRIANKTGTNNDFQRFERVLFGGVSRAKYWINAANTYFEQFNNGGGGTGEWGIYATNGLGSFSTSQWSTGSLFGEWIGTCNGTALINDNFDTEGGTLRLYMEVPVSCQQPVEFRGPRQGGSLATDGFWIVTGGPMKLSGLNNGAGSSSFKVLFRDALGDGLNELVSTNNTYPSGSTPFDASGGATYISLGDSIGVAPQQSVVGTVGPFTVGWDGYLGIVTNAATKTIVAPCKGHFTSLSCVATLTGTCTTVPEVNVTDVTGSTTGTKVTLTTTVGTPVTQAETLVFNATDVIGLAQTASPATCTVPTFACNATATCP